MAIPMQYNIRSVVHRWRPTLVAVLSIAGTVAVFIVMLAMAQGFRSTLVSSGSPRNALILRGGQTLSVKEGDEIVPGYKVLRLSAESIIVQGPTGETRTFPRQGDRP